MTRTSLFVVLGLAAAEIAAVATMMPASAQTAPAITAPDDAMALPVHGERGDRGHERQKRGERDRGDRMGDRDGRMRGGQDRGERMGDRDGMMRGGPDRGAMMMMGQMMQTYDTDGDGALTQDEVTAARAAQLTLFDANGDGMLDLEEYQALWLDAMRERMVDRFQAHDDDGTGTITQEEFGEEFSTLVERMDRNGDGVLNRDDMRMGRGGPMSAPGAPAPAEAPAE